VQLFGISEQFRQWANQVLKEYLSKGYSVSRRLTELEHTVAEHSRKIDFFVRTSLPPVEGIFYKGQIYITLEPPERSRQKNVRILQVRDTG